MPKMQQYTSEFKDQAVRFVFESIEPNESRKEACRRLAPKVNVKEVTLYNWVKAASPAAATGTARAGQSGTVEELRAQVSTLRKENRELARANDILKAASAFFGAELDRQSRR
jgi:transposase